MIRFREASTLAVTKLKTRKFRLTVTVVISSLLFGLLATSSFVFHGAVDGVNNISRDGLGSRYIIGGQPDSSENVSLQSNPEIVNRAIALHNQLIQDKKQAAKSLGIEYDSKAEPLPYSEIDNQGKKEKALDLNNVSAKRALAEYRLAKPAPGLEEFKKIAKNYDPQSFYISKTLGYNNQNFRLNVIKNGKESYNPNAQQGDPNVRGTDSFSYGWQLISQDLLKPFLLDDTTSSIGNDGSIPVVAPYTAVEQLLSLQPLSKTASSEERLDRIKEVRKRASSIQFEVCYRNKSSMASYDDAYQIQQDLKTNANNKDYVKPSLILDSPAAACGPVRIVKDSRTYDEKVLDTKNEIFRQKFGEPKIENQIVKFRVIGLSSDPPDASAIGVSQVFSSILNSSIGTGWFTPVELENKSSVISTIFSPENVNGVYSQTPPVLVEFKDPDMAEKFAKEQNCEPDYSKEVTFDNTSTMAVTNCINSGKYFYLLPFGSSSLAINGFSKSFAKIFTKAAMIIAVIAAIIMMGTVGRIIADSRRETAVFRALGAKRIDVSQIYITYSLMLSMIIIGCVIALGLIIASILDRRYGPSITIEALLAYNSRDLTKQIHLYAFNSKDLLYLGVVIILVGIASTILPLLNNLRRNPIKDMRDEN